MQVVSNPPSARFQARAIGTADLRCARFHGPNSISGELLRTTIGEERFPKIQAQMMRIIEDGVVEFLHP
jgi:hypothetical protein